MRAKNMVINSPNLRHTNTDLMRKYDVKVAMKKCDTKNKYRIGYSKLEGFQTHDH